MAEETMEQRYKTAEKVLKENLTETLRPAYGDKAADIADAIIGVASKMLKEDIGTVLPDGERLPPVVQKNAALLQNVREAKQTLMNLANPLHQDTPPEHLASKAQFVEPPKEEPSNILSEISLHKKKKMR